ncbi:MAG: hypothetical protein ACREMN_09500 [Gemmatimonadales bacterium]
MPTRWMILAASTACAAGGGVPAAANAPRLEFEGPAGSGEPNLTVTPDGRAVLTWLEPAGEQRHTLRFAVRDAGAWSEPRTILDSDSFFVNWADFPSLVALPGGAWIAHWLARVPGGTYAYHVRLAISRDQGRTWSRPLTAHRDRTAQEHGFVSLIPWDDSTAALVWLDGREMTAPQAGAHDAAGDMTLRFTTVTAGGRLGEEMLLDRRTCECCQTALARAAAGPVAAYRDRSPEEIRDITIVRRVGSTWTEPARVAADNWHYPGCPVNGPQLAAAGDTVAIAWFTAPDGAARVQVAFSVDGGATWSAAQRVDDGRPQGRVDVVLLNGGDALVTWVEGTSEIRARRVERDGDASRSWRVSETSQGRAGGFPRIVPAGGEILYAWTSGAGVRIAAQRLD